MQSEHHWVHLASLLVASSIGLGGCGFGAGWSHGSTQQEYQERTLPSDSEVGQRRLDIEAEYDPVVRHHRADNGDPELFRVVDPNTLHFYYLAEDSVVVFRRAGWNVLSKTDTHRPIPDSFLQNLSPQDLQELREQRARVAAPTDADEQFDRCFQKCQEVLTELSREACFDRCL